LQRDAPISNPANVTIIVKLRIIDPSLLDALWRRFVRRNLDWARALCPRAQ
jgi:hypothetical protein